VTLGRFQAGVVVGEGEVVACWKAAGRVVARRIRQSATITSTFASGALLASLTVPVMRPPGSSMS